MRYIIIFGLLLILSHRAWAEADTGSIDAQLDKLQSEITQGIKGGTLTTEQGQALLARQGELSNRAARLKAENKPTPDEQQAMLQSIGRQEALLQQYEKPALAARMPRQPDPASVPPQTYIAPNIGNTMTTLSNGAVVANPGPVVTGTGITGSEVAPAVTAPAAAPTATPATPTR